MSGLSHRVGPLFARKRHHIIAEKLRLSQPEIPRDNHGHDYIKNPGPEDHVFDHKI
jgi:hypothetical protein